MHDATDAPPVTTRATQSETPPSRLANPGAVTTAAEPEMASVMSAALTLPAPIEGVIQKGQTAVGIFRQVGVTTTQVMELQRVIHPVYDLRLLRTGQPYRIQLTSDGALQTFTYEIDSEDRLEVAYQGETFTGRIEPIRYTRRERVISGRIDDSVHATLMAQDESPRLVSDFANIFAWVIDFDTDLHQGDTFRLLIEERWRDGTLPHYHRILAAELINRERVWQAVYYSHDQQEAYYQPDGRSLRGMFLRSPLQYTRISSRFTHRRFHPILKNYRPHLGVDYAAPLGTPVRSVAAGTVRWAGAKGASGNMIQIHHNHTYTSYYLHLSRLARGIRRGTRVQQSQIIGYVGSTGLSTGPHLDFRLTQHGEYINPLTHKSIEAPPLSPQVLPTFRSYAKNTLAKLSQPESVLQRSAATAERE
jgi:murein DD-endopeptidase MepM/ murein hydrolase activator NlpD